MEQYNKQIVIGSLAYDEDDLDKYNTVSELDLGLTVVACVTLPAFVNAITGTFYIKDFAGHTIHSTAAVPKGGTTVIALSVPIGKGWTYGVLLSGAAGGTGGTIDIHIYRKNL